METPAKEIKEIDTFNILDFFNQKGVPFSDYLPWSKSLYTHDLQGSKNVLDKIDPKIGDDRVAFAFGMIGQDKKYTLYMIELQEDGDQAGLQSQGDLKPYLHKYIIESDTNIFDATIPSHKVKIQEEGDPAKLKQNTHSTTPDADGRVNAEKLMMALRKGPLPADVVYTIGDAVEHNINIKDHHARPYEIIVNNPDEMYRIRVMSGRRRPDEYGRREPEVYDSRHDKPNRETEVELNPESLEVVNTALVHLFGDEVANQITGSDLFYNTAINQAIDFSTVIHQISSSWSIEEKKDKTTAAGLAMQYLLRQELLAGIKFKNEPQKIKWFMSLERAKIFSVMVKTYNYLADHRIIEAIQQEEIQQDKPIDWRESISQKFVENTELVSIYGKVFEKLGMNFTPEEVERIIKLNAIRYNDNTSKRDAAMLIAQLYTYTYKPSGKGIIDLFKTTRGRFIKHLQDEELNRGGGRTGDVLGSFLVDDIKNIIRSYYKYKQLQDTGITQPAEDDFWADINEASLVRFMQGGVYEVGGKNSREEVDIPDKYMANWDYLEKIIRANISEP